MDYTTIIIARALLSTFPGLQGWSGFICRSFLWQFS